MINRLKEFQARRSEFVNGADLSSCLVSNKELRNEIEILSKAFFHKNVSGCSNCYMDAYVKLMNLKIEEAMQKIECPFKLKAGALLQDINDRTKLCSQANITTELALHHLSKNPDCKRLFIQLPENWEQMISEKVIAEIQEENSEDEEHSEFTEDEEKVIAEIQVLLSEKTSKTDIKAKYAKIELIGEKKFTGVLLTSLIKEAEERNSKSE